MFKTKQVLPAFLLFAGILLVASCYYDKADLLYPNSMSAACDTTTVSYVNKVVPVLSQNCYSCHTAGNPGGGVVMGTYADDKVLADNGKLSGVIHWEAGFSPMPKGSTKMTTCQLAKITRWISAGSPNN